MLKNSALLFSAIRICAAAIVLSAGLHLFSEKINNDKQIGFSNISYAQENISQNQTDLGYQLLKLKDLNIKIKKINPDFTPRHADFNAIKLGNDQIMFIGGSHLTSEEKQGSIDIFNTKTNLCRTLKSYDFKYSDDFENGILLTDKKNVILSGHKVGIFNLKTNKIKSFDDLQRDRDFYPILKDTNTLYRIMPDNELFGCSKLGECIGEHDYLSVLSTDLRTGKTTSVNKFPLGDNSVFNSSESYSDPNYIKYDENTILIYKVGLAVVNKSLVMYSYNIAENKFTKLIKIDNIGYNGDVSAQVLKDGTILFAGGNTREGERGNYDYLPAAIYDVRSNKVVKRPKMLYKNIPASFKEVMLIPLRNGDILVLESGTFRQYFDFASKSFKPLEKQVNIDKSSDQKITVINNNKILISHGKIKSQKNYGYELNTSAWILQY